MWMNELIIIIIQSDERKCVQFGTCFSNTVCAQDPRADDGSVVEPLVWGPWGTSEQVSGLQTSAGVQVESAARAFCHTELDLCGCRLLVGWVCCLCFPKTKETKNTQLCVCVCFGFIGKAELLIIGAFNGTVHSKDAALVALHSSWPAFS